MRKLFQVLFVSILFVTLIYPQKKLDKIFIDEQSILVGEILNESEKLINFFDLESGENITFFKQNIFKVIYADGSITEYRSRDGISYDKDLSIHPLIEANPNFKYGFVELDWLPNPVNEVLIKSYKNYQYPETLKYIYVKCRGKETQDFFIELNNANLHRKTRIGLVLTPGKYFMEIYECSGSISVKGDILTEYWENLKRTVRGNANNLIASYNIDVEKYQTTLIPIEREIVNTSNLLFRSYDLVYNRISEPKILYDNQVFEKFLKVLWTLPKDNLLINLDY